MVRAVGQRDPRVHHRVTGQDSGSHRLLGALIDGRDVLGRDLSAGDLVDELVAAAGARGLHVDDHVGVLAFTTGLLDVANDHLLDGLLDGLAVGHLRLANVGADVELTDQSVDEDLEVELAHPGDDRLAGLFVGVNPERRVLLRETLEGGAELVGVGLRLRLDRDVDDGGREDHLLEQDGVLRITEGVTGKGLLQTHDCNDVAGEDRFLVLAVIGVHLEQPTDALFAVARRVGDRITALELSGVDAHVGQATHVRIAHDLERQGRERLEVIGLTHHRLARGGVLALVRKDIQRAGEIEGDRVQERLDRFVLECAAAKDGGDRARDRGRPEALADLVDRDVLLVEVLLHDLFVVVGDGLDEVVVVLLGQLLHVIRDGTILPLFAHPLGRPVVSDHRDEVDHSVEVLFTADGELDHNRPAVQAVRDHAHAAVEVRPGSVHLVDEADPGDAVPVGLPPDRLRLRLDPGNSIEHRYRTVEDAQRAFDLDREVDVSRRVDDVDPVALPVTGRCGRGDRDAALLLLDHPVHDRAALVDLTDLVGLSGVIEDPLGRRRLARVDVGHDPDIARVVERVLPDVRVAPTALYLLERRRALLLLLSCLCHQFLCSGVSSRRAATTCSERTPCSLRPSCACPRGA